MDLRRSHLASRNGDSEWEFAGAQPQRERGADQRGERQEHEYTGKACVAENDSAASDTDGSAKKAASVEHAGSLAHLRQRQCCEADSRAEA